jgi:tetratricopeptide (TPR) repeat protein
MRVPLFVAIPLTLIIVALIWWTGTRNMDFLTPPSEARLEKIRTEALASLPVNRIEDDAISIKVPTPDRDPALVDPIQVDPVDLGDVKSPPVLDTYSDRAPEGAAKLIALAAALEEIGSFQRALLAYERVLDLSQSDPEQIQSALAAIRRLRPTLPRWNSDKEAALPVVIHIGTGEKFAEVLPEILGQITADLNSASSGLIRFSFKLNIGRSIQTTDAPTPVALWLTGAADDAPSTDVLSFTTDDPEILNADLLKTIFNLIRGHLSKSASYNPAPEALDDPMEALESNITRLLWREFGTLLNPAVEE